MLSAKHFAYIISFNPHHNYEIGTIITSFTNEELETLKGQMIRSRSQSRNEMEPGFKLKGLTPEWA